MHTKDINLPHVHNGKNGLPTSCVPEILQSHVNELLKEDHLFRFIRNISI